MSIDSDFGNLVQTIVEETPVTIVCDGDLFKMYGWRTNSNFSGYRFETPKLALKDWIKTICDEHELLRETLIEKDAILAELGYIEPWRKADSEKEDK